MALRPKQQRFVDEYLADLSPADAYMRAGYKVTNRNVAKVNGNRLLTNADVAEAIHVAMLERRKRVEITQDYVLRTIVETVEDAKKTAVIHDDDGNVVGAQIRDRGTVLRGAELLGKHLGMWVDVKAKVPPTSLPLERRREILREWLAHQQEEAGKVQASAA